ncbi:MAG: Ribonuclease PH, partial [uncultured Acidimicrobiales bacterium]
DRHPHQHAASRRAGGRRAAPRHLRAGLHRRPGRVRARRLRPDEGPVHRLGGRRRAPVAAGDAQGVGDRGVLVAPGIEPGAGGPGGGQGQAVGAHAGDPAPHRPLAADRHRPHEDARGADRRRLRHAPGRRRHAHRQHLRRVGGAPRRPHADGRLRPVAGAPAHHRLRGDLRGDRRRRAAARPALRGGLAGRRRHERGHDRRRPLRGGAGDGRGAGVLPGGARRHARPGPEGDRRAPGPPGGRGGRPTLAPL